MRNPPGVDPKAGPNGISVKSPVKEVHILIAPGPCRVNFGRNCFPKTYSCGTFAPFPNRVPSGKTETKETI